MVKLPADATTVTVYTALPLKWILTSAEFVVTDGGTQPAIDNGLRVTLQYFRERLGLS